jgi:hypothetical protein
MQSLFCFEENYHPNCIRNRATAGVQKIQFSFLDTDSAGGRSDLSGPRVWLDFTLQRHLTVAQAGPDLRQASRSCPHAGPPGLDVHSQCESPDRVRE